MLTIDEVQRRKAEAAEAVAQNIARMGWYSCLAGALQERQKSGEGLDLSSHWFSYHELWSALRRIWGDALMELRSSEREDLMIKLLVDTLGDELNEFGVQPVLVPIRDAFDFGAWIFFLKPGQEPTFPW